MDIVAAAALLTGLSPLLLALAALVKLTSRGPALYRWRVVGRHGHPFVSYKFRSMVANADALKPQLLGQNEMTGPVFKLTLDPRVTPLGRWLRRYSLDELPQLWSVLVGDMSLVGPRPLPVRDYEGFNEDWQRRRFSVKPGITCLWQVGGRSDIPFDQWMRLDLQYLDEWSLWLDLKILTRTVPAVLRGSGAA